MTTVPLLDSLTQANVQDSPQWDRSATRAGIAHIGVGNFHRSHQAFFVQNYLQATPEDWMIHGIACLQSDTSLMKAMESQDFIYSLTERSASNASLRAIGSIKTITHAPSDNQAAIDVLASREIKIISLTITEKGYCYTSTGDLDVDHPLIKNDLANGQPASAFGLLIAAVQQRMESHQTPFTIMSCDNLPGNGHLTERLLLQFAEKKNPSTVAWIEANVRFPNSMVDRITPATSDETVSFVENTFNIADQAPVVCEPYLQWVIEDNFINGRPALEIVGAEFVPDVEPYEVMKVRLLNGSHSALSYISYLMGYRQVDEAMADPLISKFVRSYMDNDITPTLIPPQGYNLEKYKDTLIERFSNPAISDQIQRLALDGSQKIRNAIVPPLAKQLETSGSIKYTAFALAGWYRYLRALDEQNQPISVNDPIAQVLKNCAAKGPQDALHLLSLKDLFGDYISADQRILDATNAALVDIDQLGTKRALEKLLNS